MEPSLSSGNNGWASESRYLLGLMHTVLHSLVGATEGILVTLKRGTYPTRSGPAKVVITGNDSGSIPHDTVDDSNRRQQSFRPMSAGVGGTTSMEFDPEALRRRLAMVQQRLLAPSPLPPPGKPAPTTSSTIAAPEEDARLSAVEEQLQQLQRRLDDMARSGAVMLDGPFEVGQSTATTPTSKQRSGGAHGPRATFSRAALFPGDTDHSSIVQSVALLRRRIDVLDHQLHAHMNTASIHEPPCNDAVEQLTTTVSILQREVTHLHVELTAKRATTRDERGEVLMCHHGKDVDGGGAPRPHPPQPSLGRATAGTDADWPAVVSMTLDAPRTQRPVSARRVIDTSTSSPQQGSPRVFILRGGSAAPSASYSLGSGGPVKKITKPSVM